MNIVLNEIEKVLRMFLEKVRSDADKIIRDNKAIASGELVKNLRYEVAREAGRIVGVVGVGGNAPHAIFVHEGTKPHWPPQLAIQQWIISKGFVKLGGKPTTHGRLRALYQKNRAESDRVTSEIQNIAYLIARKISQKGTKAIPFLKMALNMNQNFLMQKLAAIKI